MAELALRVLVVDDDVDACANLQDILTEFGESVAIAHTGEAAVQLARDDEFDVALLDLRLPGMDGLQAFREIKEASPRTEVLILSAFASTAAADQALAAGARCVLHKPVNVDRLLPLLKDACESPS